MPDRDRKFEPDSIERDELVDKIADLLMDSIGFADCFEARDFARKVIAEAQLQWERTPWETP